MQKTTDLELSHLLGFLGLCRKAGKTVLGTPMVCEELAKKKKPALVLYSAYASAATKKRVICKCEFYKTQALAIPADTGVLARALGKTGDLAALAVTDEGFADAIRKKIALLPTPSAIPPISTGKDASPTEAGDKI